MYNYSNITTAGRVAYRRVGTAVPIPTVIYNTINSINVTIYIYYATIYVTIYSIL